MKITFIGTGNMGCKKRANTSVLIDDLLIDIGCGTVKQLGRLDIETKRIKYILISHFHSDHFAAVRSDDDHRVPVCLLLAVDGRFLSERILQQRKRNCADEGSALEGSGLSGCRKGLRYVARIPVGNQKYHWYYDHRSSGYHVSLLSEISGTGNRAFRSDCGLILGYHSKNWVALGQPFFVGINYCLKFGPPPTK